MVEREGDERRKERKRGARECAKDSIRAVKYKRIVIASGRKESEFLLERKARQKIGER